MPTRTAGLTDGLHRRKRGFTFDPPDDAAEGGGEPSDVVVKRDVFMAYAGSGS